MSGLGRLLQERRRVRLYRPTIVWVGLLLVLHVQTWWAMFGLRTLQNWSSLAFLLVLLQPVVLYFLAAIVDLQNFAADSYPSQLDRWCRATLKGWGITVPQN